jgi:dTDP-4-amino-4,6-dideoxygalactose transaminase
MSHDTATIAERKRAAFLPFSRPTIEDDEVAEVVDSLRSGWITTGPKVERFEAAIKERVGAPHAIAVASATAGMHILLAALGIGAGDEVIVPSITWCSTANVVELVGASAILADVDPDTLNMGVEDARRRITPRTKAIIVVHYAGQPVDLDGFRALAKETGLLLIEDAAHALGTAYKGAEVGATGDYVVFSFHAIKNVTTGEGGMIVVKDDALADRLRLLRFHGVSKDAWKRYHKGGTAQYEVLFPGFKYNIMDLQAALGLRQLAKLDRFNERRRALAARYDAALATVPCVRPLGRVPWDHVHAAHLFIARLETAELTLDRNEVMAALQQENIGTGLHFPALHVQPYYREKYGLRPEDLPHAAAAGASILSLPLYPLMSEDDVDDVVAALRRVITAHRRAV